MAKKWIQKARKKMREKGTEGSYGHHTEEQDRKNIRKGGKIGKKAQFALNMKKIRDRKKGRKTHSRRR